MPKRKEPKMDDLEYCELLSELYPAMKIADIKFLAKTMSKQDIEELFDNMGFDKKQRKEYE